jgi:signal transduction histidine kinase/DNA-binding response OmpR family regulator/ligand-binding sensor domain-containing protein
MDNVRHTYVALVLLLLCFHTLVAQEKLLPVFHFNHLTTAEGLPTNHVRSNVVRDRQGFIWVGTVTGLARFDGYSCKVYRNRPGDPHSLSSDAVVALHVDAKGRLWIGTYASGLSLYDAMNDRFVNFLPRRGDSSWLQAKNISHFYEDDSGILWLGSGEPQVVALDLGVARDETNADSIARHARFRTIVSDLFKDGLAKIDRWDDSNLLVSTSGGLFTINRETGAITRPGLPRVSGQELDTTIAISHFWETPQKLWLATLFHGLYLFDRSTHSVIGYHKRSRGERNHRDGRIQELQQDRSGRIWIATGEGVDLFDPRTGGFCNYLSSSGAPSKSVFTRMSIDSAGTVWISTADDGIYFLPPSAFRFPQFALQGSPGWPMYMSTINRWPDGSYWFGTEGKVVNIRLENLKVLQTVDLFKGEKSSFGPGAWDSFDDEKGNLWFGTWGLGLYRFEPRSGRVLNFRSSTQLTDLLVRTDVCRSILGVNHDMLWVAAYDDGVLSFDVRTNRFSRVPNSPSMGLVAHLMKESSGRIWMSDEFLGLYVFDPQTERWDHLEGDTTALGSIGIAQPQKTYQDPQGRIWVGCKPLNLWEPETRSFKPFPNVSFQDAAYGSPLGTDSHGRLWVRYGGGLGILDLNTNRFANFDFSDGLIDVTAMSPLQDGRVLLAGYPGISIVNPDSLFIPQRPPPLVVTKFLINDTMNVPLRSMPKGNALELEYNDNVLEFEFAAIDPGATHLIEYFYRLEGLEQSWVPSGRRYVRYPGLSPGKYVFRAKAVNKFGRWPDQEIALAITITPPWWRTIWAYAAYGLFVVGILLGGYRLRLRQIQLKQEAEMEHFQAEHLAEVDRLKSRFFANISHEFRTPLTLILGPIQKWRDRAHEEDEKKDLRMAERNAHRLLRLINQLLDLSKLEAGAMKLRATRINIVPLVKGLAYSFESSAGLRSVNLDVRVEQDQIEVYCDKDMVEKILSNLLSNAFKFTAEGGKVEVRVTPSPPLSISREGVSRGRGEWVTITVSDTGIGIPPGELDKVFDRFYQVDASQTREHEGSGLGLALVKELVELHHGTIQVQSEVGKGTTFTVRLPLGRGHLKDNEIVDVPVAVEPAMREAEGALAEKASERAEPEQVRGEKPIILVVEDNADVRTYIKGYLVPAYQVMEARDGVEGIEKAQETVPDLIISDVMMPKKDGYEVCRTLKLDERTSHIPVILLTAKAASESKIEGLETGADDYLIKPFEPKELLARVKNLIDLRRRLRERFKIAVPLKPGEVAVASMDDVFLKRVMSAVDRHMADESFHTEELAAEVAMSRMQLHRKLTALTNQSPGEFIRYLRLHRGMELLQKGAGTVSEIAYTVGFSDPSYFSKCFHKQFGKAPTEVRRAVERPGSLS